MSQMIRRGRELIRIAPTDPGRLEFSTNEGRVWMTRCRAVQFRSFLELFDSGNEILARTEKGLFFSRNEGRVWMLRSR